MTETTTAHVESSSCNGSHENNTKDNASGLVIVHKVEHRGEVSQEIGADQKKDHGEQEQFFEKMLCSEDQRQGCERESKDS